LIIVQKLVAVDWWGIEDCDGAVMVFFADLEFDTSNGLYVKPLHDDDFDVR
jgi:hypothetical protein